MVVPCFRINDAIAELIPPFAYELFGALTSQSAPSAGKKREAVIGICFPKPVARDIKEFQKPLRTLRSGPFSRDLGGDVARYASITDKLTIFCKDRRSTRLDPKTATVRLC
jgi:hypothetical protein